ncbi:ribonuclease H-like domain-containing protein [Hygrophoropsis aurantiaca]|uniref:Ribonuclease H-like domain-containing protein n=1 Tax=Hygrophoropsis aurantiaca TaxID=72124 RepID=A0ACB8AQS9_9AGAM|nr:ribonuclease H-like domain-containing protein [Hygrophoropsis aurantiaca]
MRREYILHGKCFPHYDASIVDGIYRDECEQQVKGFTGAVFKKFPSEAEAQAWIAGVAPSSSSHQIATTSSSRTSANVGSSGSSSKPAAQDEDERGCIVVYCDGACKGNGKAGSVAGVGVWWGAGDPRNIAERCPGDQTNNRAELIGIVRVLETAPPSSRPLLIKTDSSYSISCIEVWFSKWVRNGFRTGGGERVKHQEIIRYISALIAARKKAGQEVRFKHVRGHVGIVGNEGADQLANLGAVMSVVPELNWGKLQEKVEASTEEDDVSTLFWCATAFSQDICEGI